MENFLKFIFFLFVTFYLLRIALKYLIPWLLARFFNKQSERFNSQSGFTENKYKNPEKGKVKIRKTTTKKSNKDNGLGEYIDFEEIE